MKYLAATVLLFALTGCSPSEILSALDSAHTAASAPRAAHARQAVAWDDYAPGLRARIDAYSATPKVHCRELQATLDTVSRDSASMLSSIGHSNSSLIAYVTESMSIAHCM